MAKKKTEFDFEGTLTELEALVDRMEEGSMGLEESVRQFERGIALTRACQKALREAEQKVEILLQENGSEKLAEFTPEDKEE